MSIMTRGSHAMSGSENPKAKAQSNDDSEAKNGTACSKCGCPGPFSDDGTGEDKCGRGDPTHYPNLCGHKKADHTE